MPTKPVAALIAGQSAPTGKRMGHAGAIITGAAARVYEKMNALATAGVAIIPARARSASPSRRCWGRAADGYDPITWSVRRQNVGSTR